MKQNSSTPSTLPLAHPLINDDGSYLAMNMESISSEILHSYKKASSTAIQKPTPPVCMRCFSLTRYNRTEPPNVKKGNAEKRETRKHKATVVDATAPEPQDSIGTRCAPTPAGSTPQASLTTPGALLGSASYAHPFTMSQLPPRALIVCVVDVTDFPNSIPPFLAMERANRSVVLVANRADTLPCDIMVGRNGV